MKIAGVIQTVVVVAVVSSLAFLSACGGGGGGGGSGVNGVFIDAAVSGATYKCGQSASVLGTTTSSGGYSCPEGFPVSFYVGDILIGQVSAPQAVITPLDLVGVAGASASNVHATSITQFLMSISSSDPNSGVLTIPPTAAAAALGQVVDFANISQASLSILVNLLSPGSSLVSPAVAQAHLTSSLNGIFAGSYSGTYSGSDDSGTWTVNISDTGVATGTYTGISFGVAASGVISGNMSTTFGTGGTYQFAGTASSSTDWLGTLDVNSGIFSGNWSYSGGSGSYSGVKM